MASTNRRRQAEIGLVALLLLLAGGVAVATWRTDHNLPTSSVPGSPLSGLRLNDVAVELLSGEIAFPSQRRETKTAETPIPSVSGGFVVGVPMIVGQGDTDRQKSELRGDMVTQLKKGGIRCVSALDETGYLAGGVATLTVLKMEVRTLEQNGTVLFDIRLDLEQPVQKTSDASKVFRARTWGRSYTGRTPKKQAAEALHGAVTELAKQFIAEYRWANHLDMPSVPVVRSSLPPATIQ